MKSDTKDAYAPVSTTVSADTKDIKSHFATLSDQVLEDNMFQLTLDLKSIEGQFYASRARYFAGNQKDGDREWYAKMRSVQAIKVTQLMCAEREFNVRVKTAREQWKTDLHTFKTNDPVDFKEKFFQIAHRYLSPDTLNRINAFVVGNHSGGINTANGWAMPSNWDELKKSGSMDLQ